MSLTLAVLAAVALLDQAVKVWVVAVFEPFEVVPVIPGLFNLTRLANTGAAFGILSSAPPAFTRVFFAAVAVTALAVLGYAAWRCRHGHWLVRAGLGLVAGGALGNLVDRLRSGAVIDFLDFYIGPYHWPAFNLADSAITVGVGFLLAAEVARGRAPGGGRADRG